MSEQNFKNQNNKKSPDSESRASTISISSTNSQGQAVGNGATALEGTAAPTATTAAPAIDAANTRLAFQSTDFVVGFLSAHNELRKQHRAGELELDNGLCAEAEQLARQILNNESVTLPKPPIFGINTYESSDQSVNGVDVVKHWYSEIKNYDFERPHYADDTKHFVQMIWRDTKEIGFSTARSANKVVIVALYRPVGNIEKLMGLNVRRNINDESEDETSNSSSVLPEHTNQPKLQFIEPTKKKDT